MGQGKDGDLSRARALLGRGRYAECVRLLEGSILENRENAPFFSCLGKAELLIGDSGSALTYLKRADQLEPDDSGILLCMGVAHMKRGEPEQAIKRLLAALDIDPREPRARKALAFLREDTDPSRLRDAARRGVLDRFVPRPSRFPRMALVAALGLLAALGLALAFRFVYPLVSVAMGTGSRERPGLEAFVLSSGEKAAPVSTGGSYRIVLTEDEAIASFERAKKAFSTYDDNIAIVEANRILSSNAAESIRAKAGVLKSLVVAPGFDTIRDSPAFAEVAGDPWLYEDCFVAWRGQAANITGGDSSVSFDLLVGYQDKARLEGIARVSLPFAAEVRNDEAIEILGRVVLEGKRFALHGIAIHVIGGGR